MIPSSLLYTYRRLYLLFRECFLGKVVHAMIVLIQTKLGAIHRPCVQSPVQKLVYKFPQLCLVVCKLRREFYKLIFLKMILCLPMSICIAFQGLKHQLYLLWNSEGKQQQKASWQQEHQIVSIEHLKMDQKGSTINLLYVVVTR